VLKTQICVTSPQCVNFFSYLAGYYWGGELVGNKYDLRQYLFSWLGAFSDGIDYPQTECVVENILVLTKLSQPTSEIVL